MDCSHYLTANSINSDILYMNFNQDNRYAIILKREIFFKLGSCLSVGTKTGIRLYNCGESFGKFYEDSKNALNDF